jgi:hypothetical protein
MPSPDEDAWQAAQKGAVNGLSWPDQDCIILKGFSKKKLLVIWKGERESKKKKQRCLSFLRPSTAYITSLTLKTFFFEGTKETNYW